MADFRALCAELTDTLDYWLKNSNLTDSDARDLVQEARAALAQPEPKNLPKNCWLDDEPDIWPSPCVFEDPEEVISNCAYASVLHSEGKCKTDCQHYCQPISEGDFDGQP
jgi:hypothetical protein